MGKQPIKESDDTSVPPTSSTALLLLGTFADTTWRMLVPSVGFTLVGVWLDSMWGTKPWIMALGIVIGSIGAVLLVKQQFVKVKQG